MLRNPDCWNKGIKEVLQLLNNLLISLLMVLNTHTESSNLLMIYLVLKLKKNSNPISEVLCPHQAEKRLKHVQTVKMQSCQSLDSFYRQQMRLKGVVQQQSSACIFKSCSCIIKSSPCIFKSCPRISKSCLCILKWIICQKYAQDLFRLMWLIVF